MGASLTRASIALFVRGDKRLDLRRWVPTANGRLSFRHLGETRRRNFRRYANTIDGAHHRIVLGVEKRKLSDLLFRKFTEIGSGRSGAFWFLINCSSSVAKIGNLDALEGSVRIFKPQRFRAMLGNSNFLSRLKELQQHHIGLKIIGNLEEYTKELILPCLPVGDIEVAFTLFRDGEIRMQRPIFADENLARESEASLKREAFPFTNGQPIRHTFLLRDFCHAHQHHRPEIDTIVILQDDDGTETSWRNHIIYSMHHYVIRIRRSLQCHDLYRGIGVLAYIKAFRGVYEARIKQAIVAEPIQLAIMQECAIEMSLRRRIDELTTLKTDRDKRTDQAIAESVGYRNLFFLFYIGVITAVAALFTPYVEEHKSFWSKVGDDLVESSNTVAISIVALLCATWVLTSPKFFDGSLYRHNFLFVIDILTVSLLHRKIVGTISTCLSLLLVLAVFLIYHAR